MAININIPIEDAVTDGSLNPVTSNAVFDALALKANTADLGATAFSNDYNDLDNLPAVTSGTVTSVGLTMPSAFTVANTPITSSGDIAVTGAGLANQYIRGDGTLATFPTSGGGGNNVNYYLNGGTAASVATYYQMSKTAVIGTGVDFSLAGNGLISQWLTDVSDPNVTEIPAGNWNFEMFFSASSAGGVPKFYIEILKYNGSTFTTIANNSLVPESITSGTAIDLYLTSVPVPLTTMLTTDRIALRVYIVDSVIGRTITQHTQDSHLCQVITTFSSGVSSINGLTEQTQYLTVGTSGTDFAINSATDTHTFNLPTASATKRGALSSTDWSTFNGKQNAITLTTTGSGAATFIADTLNIPTPSGGAAAGITGQIQFNNGGAFGADSNLFWDNTNKRLGVGTGTPLRSLDINGVSRFRNFIGVDNSDANSRTIFFTNGDNLNTIASGRIRSSELSFFVNSNELFKIFTTRNVVIQDGGTFTDAGFRLDVNGTTRLNGNTSIGGGTAAARLDIRAQGALSTDIAFRVRNSADTGDIISQRGNGQLIFSNVTSTYILNPRTDADGFSLTSGNGAYGTGNGLEVIGSSYFVRSGVRSFEFAGTSISERFVLKNESGDLIIFHGSEQRFSFRKTNFVIGGNIESPTLGATKILAMYTGVAPSVSAVDGIQMYSADIVAGNAAPHFRTENGSIIKLYKETTAVTASTLVSNLGTPLTDTDTFDGYTLKQIVKALRNLGILA